MKRYSLSIGSNTLTLTFDDLVAQANGSVMVQYGDTIVLAAVVQARGSKPDLSFFPLTVDYEERFYAGGKISGSRFVRREGRPSDEAILAARMIDRTIRPLFDKRERRETQVVITVISFDKVNDPDVIAMLAASMALCASNIPFNGPIGGIRLGRIGSKLIVNPTLEEREQSDVDIVLGGKRGLINMIEADGKEVAEEDFQKIFEEGLSWFEKIIDFQEEIIKDLGIMKREIVPHKADSRVIGLVREFCAKELSRVFSQTSDQIVKEKLSAFQDELAILVSNELGKEHIGEAFSIFNEELEKELQRQILKDGIRSDSRRPTDLRQIFSQVGVLPRVHGSAIFRRGLTHALSVVTLGSPGDERWIEGMGLEERQHFMHHYNFPSFSVGEVGAMRSPSRRQLGHGYLAQKAIQTLLPSKEEFPYTIRVVTEILSSNGSTSMAATCGMSLSLMDAGVPLKKPVAGIAMGLIYESKDKYAILTDLQGPEDQEGHMDFKIAGTSGGITALQLDTKVEGLPIEVLVKTIRQSREARLKILEVMNAALGAPRASLSPFAPRMFTLRIDPAKIRFVIGPGGEVINGIIAKTGAKIDIEDEGIIFITSENEQSGLDAKAMVELITRDIKVGDTMTGEVCRIADFGAFISIGGGKEGLAHISELADGYIKSVSDVLKLGQEVKVTVIGVDAQGKIRLSLKNNPSFDQSFSPRTSSSKNTSFKGKESHLLNKKPPFYPNKEKRSPMDFLP